MTDTLRLDDLMRLAASIPPRPRLFASSSGALSRLIEAVEPGYIWHRDYPPKTIGGIKIEESKAVPAWAFAMDNGTEVLVYDTAAGVGQGYGVKKSAVAFPGMSEDDKTQAALRLGVAMLEERRKKWSAIGDAPALARDDGPGPDPQAPTLGGR